MKDTMKKNNPVLETIYGHTSVRHFTDQDVSAEDEAAIIRAAQMASSSCNLQPYSFISVRNPDMRARIAAISPGSAPAGRAPLLLMVCVDIYRLDLVTRRSGVEYTKARYLDNFLIGVADASLAAQNAVIAAEGLGYGICYLGSIRSKMEDLRKWLKLPPKVFPMYGIAIGVPAAERRNAVKPRLPMSGVWFREGYDEEAAAAAIDEYDRIMRESGVYEGRHKPLEACVISEKKAREAGGADPDSDYGWIEHSARRISSTNPADIRPNLKQILEDAGFSFE
ncbi:MAG: nitroreductase family protein [Spirochaetota bacterium]|nr:nitroreductase family protein [Spirochaetota bacterium]